MIVTKLSDHISADLVHLFSAGLRFEFVQNGIHPIRQKSSMSCYLIQKFIVLFYVGWT